jgi:hypothetical protein
MSPHSGITSCIVLALRTRPQHSVGGEQANSSWAVKNAGASTSGRPFGSPISALRSIAASTAWRP